MHRRERRLGDAAGCFAHAADLLAEEAEAQHLAGEALEAVEEIERATHYYLQAVAIHESDENLDLCLKVLRHAIELNPGRLDLMDALARLLERTGDAEAALAQWLALAETHEEQKQPKRAAGIYQHLRALLPGRIEPRRRLAASTVW